jgi:hypothetical protein
VRCERPALTSALPDDQVVITKAHESVAHLDRWKVQRLQQSRHVHRGEPAALGSVAGHLAEHEDAVSHSGELLDLKPEAATGHPRPRETLHQIVRRLPPRPGELDLTLLPRMPGSRSEPV